MLTNDPQPIRLKELIDRVKQDLLEEHDNTQPLFAIGQLELEISFTVTRDLKGGIDLKVVQTGVQKNIGEIQTIKLTLEPLLSIEEVREGLTSQQKDDIRKDVLRGRTDKK